MKVNRGDNMNVNLKSKFNPDEQISFASLRAQTALSGVVAPG